MLYKSMGKHIANFMRKGLKKYIEEIIEPSLVQSRFKRNSEKKYWRWDHKGKDAIWSIVIAKVGTQLTDIGVQRSRTLIILYGILYDFIPDWASYTRRKKISMPRVEDFHLSHYLKPNMDLVGVRWAIEKNGKNIEVLIKSICSSIESEILPWFDIVCDAKQALIDIESRENPENMNADLLNTAVYLARKAGDFKREKLYLELFRKWAEDIAEMYHS